MLYKNKFKLFLDFSLKNDQNCQIPDVFKKTDKLPVSLNYMSMVYLYTKNIYQQLFMVQLTFVYILQSLCIVCLCKNMQRQFQLAKLYLGFAQFVATLFVCAKKTNIQVSSSFLSATCTYSYSYKFCTDCIFFVYMQEFDVHFLYIH